MHSPSTQEEDNTYMSAPVKSQKEDSLEWRKKEA